MGRIYVQGGKIVVELAPREHLDRFSYLADGGWVRDVSWSFPHIGSVDVSELFFWNCSDEDTTLSYDGSYDFSWLTIVDSSFGQAVKRSYCVSLDGVETCKEGWYGCDGCVDVEIPLDAKRYRVDRVDPWAWYAQECDKVVVQVCDPDVKPELTTSKVREDVAVYFGGGGTAGIYTDSSDSEPSGEGSVSASIEWGTHFTLMAVPDECYEFLRWELADPNYPDHHNLGEWSNSPIVQLTALPALSCENRYGEVRELGTVTSKYKAIFQLRTITLTLAFEGGGSGYFTFKDGTGKWELEPGEYLVDCGGPFDIEAHPDGCYKFSEWEDGYTTYYRRVYPKQDATFTAMLVRCQTLGNMLQHSEGDLLYNRCGDLIFGYVEAGCPCNKQSEDQN